MNNLHIYTTTAQPATHFVDDCGEHRMEFKFKPRSLVWCGCCERHRIAQNAVVHVYYDHCSYWCAHGKGCNSQQYQRAKARRESRNRSRAAKRAWATRRARA